MNYNERAARVFAHEARLKITEAAAKAVPTQTVIAEFWRSGGGVVKREPGRATLVRRIVDRDFVAFQGTSRYGALVE